MRTVILAAAMIFCHAYASRGAEVTAVLVGLQKQLLVDDYAIAETHKVERVLGRVEKANDGQPIFEDGWFYGTVLHDEDRFKLWFRKIDEDGTGGFRTYGFGYAESADGIHFTHAADVSGINFVGDFNLAVELNRDDAPSQFRYIGGYDAPTMAAGIACSSDGIHWKPLNNGEAVTFRAADCHNQIIWDPIAKTYRLFTRTDFGAGGGPLANRVARDFEVRGTRVMTNPEISVDPTNWSTVRQWYFNREGPDEYLRRQIYSMTVWIYEGIYFGLMSVYEYPGDISEGRETDIVTRHDRDVMEYYIATSRDCDNWDLTWVYAGEPIVPRGPDGSFDKDWVFPSSTVVTHDDQHWFYYGGAAERHGTAELQPHVWFGRRGKIGVATLPRDRLVGWHAGPREGTIVTKPFVLKGPTLLINVDCSEGKVAVEVLDSAGEVIRGYGGDDSVVLRRVDDLDVRPTWNTKADLSELMGQTVRLRFRLTLADLYAFQVMPGS